MFKSSALTFVARFPEKLSYWTEKIWICKSASPLAAPVLTFIARFFKKSSVSLWAEHLLWCPNESWILLKCLVLATDGSLHLKMFVIVKGGGELLCTLRSGCAQGSAGCRDTGGGGGMSSHCCGGCYFYGPFLHSKAFPGAADLAFPVIYATGHSMWLHWTESKCSRSRLKWKSSPPWELHNR